MLFGQSPFAATGHTRMPTAPQPRVVEPVIEVHKRSGETLISIRAPEGFLISKQAASADKGRVAIEGVISPVPSRTRDYIVTRRTGIFAQPSRTALVGHIPAGNVIRGSAPSNAGWIALDDDESFVLDDGSLVARAPSASFPFSKLVDVGRDADLSAATVRLGDVQAAAKVGRSRWRVVFHGPRVAIRAGTHTNASVLGALGRGEVIEGVIDDVDPNWVRLLPAAASRPPAYVMIEHPTHGRLLAPLDASHDGRGVVQHAGTGAFTVHVPRRAQVPAAKPQPAVTASKRPAPPAAASVPLQRAQPSAAATVASATGSNRAEMAAARRSEKRSKGGEKPAPADMRSALMTASAVLAECPASPDNVQRPPEHVESWVAVEGGGFAPLSVP